MRELSKGWGNDGGFSDHTLTTNVDISEIPTYNTTTLDYGLYKAIHRMINLLNTINCDRSVVNTPFH